MKIKFKPDIRKFMCKEGKKYWKIKKKYQITPNI